MQLTQTLLIELGTEELPPKALNELAQSFLDGVKAGLHKRGIEFLGEARALWTPRRLAVRIFQVSEQQPDQIIERRGPAANAAFDASGAPSKALIGFAQSCGVEVSALEKLETEKGAWLVHRGLKKGEATISLVGDIVREALKALPIPKPMHWGDKDILFVRPVHWLLMLFGEQVIEGEALGLSANRMSFGHRFHHPSALPIKNGESYLDALRDAKVLADPVERRAKIRNQIEMAAKSLNGQARIPDALLDEVNNLLEWPMPIKCTFDEAFLQVPQEALLMTMESNQKFFAVFDSNGKLTQHFIGIANIQSKDENEIRKGYERVIRPRFADARFFFDEDLKTPLANQQVLLQNVTYQQKLGSVWDKVVRVAELARTIANRLGVDAALATRAAGFSKCDLLSRMVGEFPELQGVMGRYYATAQNEDAQVALALDEFYLPRFAGDKIAQGAIGRVLSVAEKLDTLAGMFAIGQKPTGSKDPFSLRRNALGLARTLIEGSIDLDLNVLALEAVSPFNQANANSVALDLCDFILDRTRGYYLEQGIRADVFEAVSALKPDSLFDFDQRLRALVEFAQLPQAQNLAAANKRISNILRQAREKNIPIAASVDTSLLEDGAEAALANALQAISIDAKSSYVDALKQLAKLQAPVDAFFDNVMVMVEDHAVRANRLSLLNELRDRFLAIADISVMQAG